jgi:endonuclease/exonuclease/phosphatase family metal-dependent hydrolase
MTLRVLFWNVEEQVPALSLMPAVVRQFAPHLVTLAEAPSNTEALLRSMNLPVRRPHDEIVPNPRSLLTFALDETLHLRERAADRHHRAYEVGRDGHESLTLVAVHLRSKTYDKGDTNPPRFRTDQCHGFVEAVERDARHTRTAVYGDFNMDPYSEAMVLIDGLNAMSTASRARGPRTSEKRTRSTFYNPMWSLFGDRRPTSDGRPSPAGTFYMDGDGPAGYFWHMPDQVLVRAELIDHLGAIDILDVVEQDALVSDRARTPSVSDHLPVLFELRESVWRRRDDT